MLLTVPCQKLAIIYLYCASLLPQILLSCMLYLYSMSLLLLLNWSMLLGGLKLENILICTSIVSISVDIHYLHFLFHFKFITFPILQVCQNDLFVRKDSLISYSVLEDSFCLVENSGFTDFTKITSHHFIPLSSGIPNLMKILLFWIHSQLARYSLEFSDLGGEV